MKTLREAIDAMSDAELVEDAHMHLEDVLTAMAEDGSPLVGLQAAVELKDKVSRYSVLAFLAKPNGTNA